MQLIWFLVRRLFQGAATLLLIAVINFMLIRAAPGDPATVMAGESGAADAEFIAQLRAKYQLDEPVLVQLWSYIGNVMRLDLGVSYRQGVPVLDLVLERLPATLLLTGTAFVISIVVGVLLGVWASSRVGTWKDTAITFMATLFYAMPVYWLALIAVLVLAVWNPWFPAYGYQTIGLNATGMARVLDVLHHLVLPALVLSTFYAAIYARMTRASMLEVRNEDFVKTARAKGLAPVRILRAHILSNALLPVVTLAGLQAGAMVGGAVLIETVFAWPGVGRLLFDALSQRDYPLLLGTFLMTGAVAIMINILTDVLYSLVDPRIELK